MVRISALTIKWFIFGVNMTRILALVIAVAMTTPLFAQKFEGPKRGTAKTLIEIKLSGDLGDDPQVLCFPESTSWKLVRAVASNDLSVIFVPVDGEDGQTFNFLFVTNKEKKTITAQHQIVIGIIRPTPVPTPPGPGPGPGPDPVKPNRFSDQLKAKYLVSPDGAALDKLIGVLMAVQATKFTSWQEARDTLKNSAKKDIDGGLDIKKLPALRDEIAYSILAKEVGDDGDKEWPQEKFSSVVGEVITALKGLK